MTSLGNSFAQQNLALKYLHSHHLYFPARRVPITATNGNTIFINPSYNLYCISSQKMKKEQARHSVKYLIIFAFLTGIQYAALTVNAAKNFLQCIVSAIEEGGCLCDC
jgi:hypothetical protein